MQWVSQPCKRQAVLRHLTTRSLPAVNNWRPSVRDPPSSSTFTSPSCGQKVKQHCQPPSSHSCHPIATQLPPAATQLPNAPQVAESPHPVPPGALTWPVLVSQALIDRSNEPENTSCLASISWTVSTAAPCPPAPPCQLLLSGRPVRRAALQYAHSRQHGSASCSQPRRRAAAVVTQRMDGLA